MRLHRLLARKLGYSLIHARRNHLELFPHLALLLERYPVDRLVDVGAHRGEFATGMRDAGYAGPITSFEPNPALLPALRERAAASPVWDVHECALGREGGRARLRIATSSEFTSFHRLNDYGTARFGVGNERDVDVDVRRLDEVLADLDSAARIALKIDTQGHDLEVFAGAGALLDRIAILVAEVSTKPIYDGAPPLEESLRVFAEAGFEPTGLFPVTRDKTTLAVIEFDAVWVRPRA